MSDRCSRSFKSQQTRCSNSRRTIKTLQGPHRPLQDCALRVAFIEECETSPQTRITEKKKKEKETAFPFMTAAGPDTLIHTFTSQVSVYDRGKYLTRSLKKNCTLLQLWFTKPRIQLIHNKVANYVDDVCTCSHQ